MSGLLSRLFGRGDGRAGAPTRLTSEEAARIARDAAIGSPLVDLLVANGVAVEHGRLVWRFWTATRGSSLDVTVDDATGVPNVQERFGR